MKGYNIIEEESYIISSHDRVVASTVSVNEFFDELIEQVRHDYANL